MPTLLFRFPGGRYHATPWGHHVNEGLIEWPPSPWRLLRTLLSAGYTRLGWDGAMHEPWRSQPPAPARTLLQKLARTPPRFSLPPATGAHSRHYMPVAAFKGDREHTTLVFDTWAQVDDAELVVHWDAALSSEEAALLEELACGIGYLGRSESWVEARLASDEQAASVQINCWPCDLGASPGPGWEQVALLAPASDAEYAAWREQRLQAALSSLPPVPLPDKKKPGAKDRRPTEQRQAERDRAQAPYPPDLIACLQTDTNWQREHGWSQPPGSRRMLYWRRSDALRSARRAPPRETAHRANVSFVLLSLMTQSGNDHALPMLARSLPQGERFHRQMVAERLRLAPGLAAPVLTGCDAQRRPLGGAHRHAHVLSLDLDGDGHIDHLLVWAPDGLDALDQQAIRRIRVTYAKGGIGELRVAWSAAGSADDLGGLPAPWGSALQRSVGGGRVWQTATPFVPPRYLKPRGANGWEGQARAELRSRGMPEPTGIELLDPPDDAGVRTLRHHVRVRQSGPPPPVDVGLALKLTFASAVNGPICLGYGSHFGLGRFERVDDA